MDLKHTQPGVWPDGIGAGRFASTISRGDPAGCRVALLGLPDDTGVKLNHGRPGAAQGPTAFRAALARYGSADPAGLHLPRVFDAGDVTPGGDLSETHDRVTGAALELHRAGLMPVGIGGGHDLTYPFVRAASQHAGQPLSGVYFDAHLDVRDETGSGMPFRRLVEGGFADALHVHGLDAFSNSNEHMTWFQAHGGHISPMEPTDPWPMGELFVSLDLDVIDQAFAPGVSATNPCGWTPELTESWCRASGACDRVRCFDIMEMSPPHDENGRTAKLAARLFMVFLIGFSGRG